MEMWKLVLIPVIGFLIGYSTNYIAIKMLFHPRKKIFGVQGVLPKRKRAFAKNISEVTIHVLPKRIRDLEKLPFVGAGIFDLVRREIEKEINSMDDRKLEEIVLKVVKKELGFITWMGGVLGFIIGLAQVAIVLI